MIWVTALRSSSSEEALVDARNETRILALGLVQPEITDALLTYNPSETKRIDEIIRTQILPLNVKRVKIWSPAGEIYYSDERRLIGETFALDESKMNALRSGVAAASVSDLDELENRFEPKSASYIEVYLPIRTPTNKPLLFEAYYPTQLIATNQDRVFSQFVPILAGALGMLLVFVGPLLWVTVRMLRTSQANQEALLQRALASSDLERARIARDLHDGVVQDLAGVSLTIAGVLDRIGKDPESKIRGPLTEAAASTRHGIRQLRTLLVDLVPRDIGRTGLEQALSDLLSSLQQDNIDTSLHMESNMNLSDVEQALVYRTAQEALRNVRRHAKATSVALSVHRHGDQVQLRITDDGVGFDPHQEKRAGSMGMELLRTAAVESRSEYTVDSSVGGGTTVLLTLPARARSTRQTR
jgi:two-component system, NarL family, sensor kinase